MTRARNRFVVAALVLPLALSGCGARLMNYRGYSGDGRFVPHAAPSSICADGYTIELGAVDLAAVGEAAFRLEGLPSMEATLGLAMTIPQGPPGGGPADLSIPRPAATVALTLRDEGGRIVLSRHERLSEWTRSFPYGTPAHAYLYQVGTEIEVPVGPGSVRVERFPVGPDESWGTYFTPRRGARYTLHFAVEEADPTLAGADARLQVNGVTGCP
jgi:hypothetical protein